MPDLDDFDIVWKDAQLYELLASVFSLVTMQNDATVFDITTCSEGLLQLMSKLLQIDTVTDGVMTLHGGDSPPWMMSLKTNHEMGWLSIKMLQNVFELKIFRLRWQDKKR